MDAFSSGEDLLIKTRKPYTITKQRERWTDEEHSRFLEALKLYGRAWQKIEEHIGTKTAVQIRSHAQKFFSKLEKEAVAKGVPVAQALDIDIPPPRPKRKPSNPYPRKSSVSSITCQVGATKDDGKLSASLPCPPNQVLDLEKEPPPEKPSGDEKSTGAKENHDDNCSEVFTSSSSIFSLKQKAHGGLSNPCSFREFVPCLKDVVSQDKSQVTTTLDGNKKWHNPDLTPKVYENGSNSKALLLGKANVNAVGLPEDKMQSTQNCPRHVPVHILDGSTLAESQGRSDVYSLSTASAAEVQKNMAGAASSTNQPFPPFPHPFTPSLNSQDDYRSFLQMSSTFSSLVGSTLLQNPAAHAAATFAASFWPYANIGNATDSSGGLSTRQLNSAPSMAAIAAATVAAATAWWAAHGILPMCSAHQTAFDCLPPAYNDPFSVANMESEENKEGALEHPPSDAAQAQISVPKSPTVSSSESGENGSAKPDGSPEAADHEMNATVPEVHNCSEPKNRKQADRSSCGSNTASSSEVETDALEKNGNEGNEELKEPDGPNLPAATDSSTRRILRSNGGMAGDSWKSVSQVGRRAFQALFSREKLPQSFSPPLDGESEGVHRDGVEMQNADEKNGEATAIDLNNEAWCLYRDESNAASINHDECFPTIGIENGKPKARRMGFKPYKRCSMEAKENMLTGPGEEKESKRIRLGVERGDSI